MRQHPVSARPVTARPVSARPVSARPVGLTVAVFTAGLTLALAMLVATAGAAQAHARFLASEPANGAQLTTAPTSVKLTFNEDMLPGSAKLRVEGPAGVATIGDIVTKATTVAAALPPDLGGGTYTVTWRVTSADGHPISGAFRYTLTLPAAATTAAPSPTATQGSPSSTDASPGGSASGGSAAASDGSSPTAATASPSLDTTPLTPAVSSTDSGATPLVIGALAVTLLAAGGLWWWRSRS